MAEFPEHPFWDFSLAVYTTEGVGDACLQLQSAHELDVNALLFCLWIGASGRGEIAPAEMGAVLEAVDAWHREVVRAMRAVRMRMKGGMPPAPPALAESIRQRIQKIEIDCEHTEQLMLAATLDRAPDESRDARERLADSVANMGCYFNALGRELSAEDRASLAIVAKPAFDGLESDTIAAAVESM